MSIFRPRACRAARARFVPAACRVAVIAVIAVIAAALSAPAAPLAAQAVDIAPIPVLLTAQQRSAKVTLTNRSGVPVEVRARLRFGYTTSDSLGESRLFFPDATAPTDPDASRMVHMYPPRVRLEPGQEKAVMFVADSVPSDLPSGEYWTQLSLESQEGVRAIDSSAAPTDVRTTLKFRIATTFPLIYRHGAVTTALRVDSLAASASADTLAVRAVLDHGGNAAYRGFVRLALRDAGRRDVAGSGRILAVYGPRAVRWPVALPAGLPAGTYQLTMTVTTTRPDVQDKRVTVPAPPVERSIDVTIPATRPK